MKDSSDGGSSNRHLPSVDRLIQALADLPDPRPIVLGAIRQELDAMRSSQLPAKPLGLERIVSQIRQRLEASRRHQLREVINATGVIVHTNLGRAPLAAAAVERVRQVASGYCNLEYDLTAGTRSSRAGWLEKALARLCEAPAATVVNNCAAALMLVIRLFAGHRERNEVLISRGELVQIGGGFRVPEILRASGARLREVGTTNRTTPDDYQSAIGERSAFILCVHRSNFYMAGFVQSPTVQELSDLARPVGLPLVVDLGSGATFPTKQLGGGEQEPIVAQTLAQGADLVTFSGDKLLGGPQAGIIAGETKAVASLKRHPLFRALRCDKLTLAALEATVELHLSGREMEIPVRRMLAIPLAELESRAQRIVSALAEVGIPAAIGKSEAQVGGGSLPRTLIPSICVELADDSTAPLLADRLRLGNPPIIGIIRDRRLRLDLRTVAAEQDELLVTAVGKAFRA